MFVSSLGRAVGYVVFVSTLASCGGALPSLDAHAVGSASKTGSAASAAPAEPLTLPPIDPTTAAPVSTLVDVVTWHSRGCVVYASGKVACWGLGPQGLLATPTFLDGVDDAKSVTISFVDLYVVGRAGKVTLLRTGEKPMLVNGLADATKLEAGEKQVCALHAGLVDCWSGWGKPLPKTVAGLQGVVDLAVGEAHACAARGDGTVVCWGSNGYGQLGSKDGAVQEEADMRSDDVAKLVSVAGISDAIGVSAGSESSCALRRTGKVVCWGSNYGNNLGRGPHGDEKVERGKVYEVAGLDDALAIRTRQNMSCALEPGGKARCWGGNDGGYLGDGTTESRESSVEVKGLEHIARIHPGEESCAITSEGRLACWGNVVRFTPATVKLASGKSLSAGTDHTCAIDGSGEVVCWGRRDIVEANTIFYRNALVPTPMGIHHASSVVSGQPSSRIHDLCAVLEGGKVICEREHETRAPGVDDATRVAVGQGHACALRRNGKVACWGSGDHMEVGVTAEYRKTAADVPGVSDVVALGAGGEATCAVKKNGTVLCWGGGNEGELGNGREVKASGPVPVTGLSDAIDVSVGFMHACALRRTGQVACWGSNLNKLAKNDSNVLHVTKPVDTGLTDAISLASGVAATCVVHRTGSVSCWGDLDDESRGGAVSDDMRWMVDVKGISDAVSVTVGDHHACASTKTGTTLCWGKNDHGQIGDGTGPGLPAFIAIPKP